MEYIDKSNILKKLWNSVDVKFHRRTLSVYLSIFCVVCVISVALRILGVYFFQIPCLAMVGVCVLLILLKLGCIFRRFEHYRFFHTTLSSPHCAKGNTRTLYFPVMIQSPEFGTLHRRTASIFYVRKRLGPLLSEYLDKEVVSAWNPKTDAVVVIGL